MRYIRLLKYIHNWWLHFEVKLGLTHKDPLIYKTRNNLSFEVPRRLIHEFKEIFLEESYLIGLGRQVPDNPVIVDIGANAGFFSIFAASVFPGAKIFSYEPIPKNFKQLKRNIAMNPMAGITGFSEAVYGYSGSVSISFDPEDSFSTAASVMEEAETQGRTIQVPCTTIPEIFIKNKLEKCDLMKIDCEGAEYEVLYNCPKSYLKQITQMAIEVHRGTGAKENVDDLREYFSAMNYHTKCSENMLWIWQN